MMKYCDRLFTQGHCVAEYTHTCIFGRLLWVFDDWYLTFVLWLVQRQRPLYICTGLGELDIYQYPSKKKAIKVLGYLFARQKFSLIYYLSFSWITRTPHIIFCTNTHTAHMLYVSAGWTNHKTYRRNQKNKTPHSIGRFDIVYIN